MLAHIDAYMHVCINICIHAYLLVGGVMWMAELNLKVLYNEVSTLSQSEVASHANKYWVGPRRLG